MILSMTGYGAARDMHKTGRGSLELRVDIKSVNSRYLDLSIRTSKSYGRFEADIAKVLRSRLRRGRVEVNVGMRCLEGALSHVQIQDAAVQSLHARLQTLVTQLNLSQSVSLSDLLHFQEWISFEENEVDAAGEWPLLETTLSRALDELMVQKRREGEGLEKVLSQHHQALSATVTEFQKESPRLMRELKSRWRDRLNDWVQGHSFSEDRLEQEFLLWLGRSDFQEELDRLVIHLEAFGDLLKGDGETCRKLEFLTQEMQREINTLGSKCPDARVIPRIVEMKTSIERIREQLQNGE